MDHPSSAGTAKTWSDTELVALLNEHSYDEVHALTGCSRGRVYHAACRLGARKTEVRIQERRREREARQLEMLKQQIGTTVRMDVLDYLDTLPEHSIDLVITSIPYNLGKAYTAGDLVDAMRPVYFEGWITSVIDELARALKLGGTLCLQVGSTRDWTGRLVPMDTMFFETCRKSGLEFQSRIVWEVPHGLTPKRRLAERYETVLVFSKGEQSVFNANPVRIPQKEPDKRGFKGPRKGDLTGHPFGAWPGNVWRIPNVGNNSPEKTGHPCQFPQELARRLILLYSNSGALVCDPFSGSGTVHVETVRTGRAFTGADLFFEELRTKRLATTLPDTVTPLPGVTDESVAVWKAEARRVDAPARHLSAREQRALFDELDDGVEAEAA
jgi:DNA modification methylase